MPLQIRRAKKRASTREIPAVVQARTTQRILKHAQEHYAGKFIHIEVRFRGQFCYIDAHLDAEPSPPPEETMAAEADRPTHLCRLAYSGHEDSWGFAFYTSAGEKYEPSCLLTGSFFGTPEEAFDTSSVYLND